MLRFASMIRFVSILCTGALLLCAFGCKRLSVTQDNNAVEPYLSDPNSVGFDISPLPAAGGSQRWLATYSDKGKTARFTIEMSPQTRMKPETGVSLKMSSGRGAILAVPGSDASAFLAALQTALEAKHFPAHVQRASRLTFDYVILGDHNSRAKGGGFSSEPAGNWTTMKIFLGNGDDESEVFLNFNPVSRKGQFSEKDIEYGDGVVAKLAPVL